MAQAVRRAVTSTLVQASLTRKRGWKCVSSVTSGGSLVSELTQLVSGILYCWCFNEEQNVHICIYVYVYVHISIFCGIYKYSAFSFMFIKLITSKCLLSNWMACFQNILFYLKPNFDLKNIFIYSLHFWIQGVVIFFLFILFSVEYNFCEYILFKW